MYAGHKKKKILVSDTAEWKNDILCLACGSSIAGTDFGFFARKPVPIPILNCNTMFWCATLYKPFV